MSLDLSHVRHASDAEAEVLPVESSGDGAGDGGLAYTRWAVEAHDLPLRGAPQLAHRDEFLHSNQMDVGLNLKLKFWRINSHVSFQSAHENKRMVKN